MAQTNYRANLSGVRPPFLSDRAGQTIINNRGDNVYVPQIQGAQPPNVGIPELYFNENVMVFDRGYRSIGFTQVGNAFPDGYNSLFYLIEINANFSLPSSYIHIELTTGNVYRLNAGTFGHPNDWVMIGNIPYTGFPFNGITQATVNGATYIFIPNYGIYLFNPLTQMFDIQSPSGLVITDILGIVAASGYMIVYDQVSVAWSSLIDPMDFTPSLVTGAGGGAVQELQGPIITALPLTGGFVLYSSQNIVSATYSGNSRYPFSFKNIGFTGTRAWSTDGDNVRHWVLAEDSIRLVSLDITQASFPDLSEFLYGKVIEVFNQVSLAITKSSSATRIQSNVTVLLSRYVVFSYTVNNNGIYNYAIIYDSEYKSFTKIKIDHTVCFEYTDLVGFPYIPRAMAFVQSNGTVNIIDPDATMQNGVLILGKYQLDRNNVTLLNSVTVEQVGSSDTFAVTDLVALDGKNISSQMTGTQANPGTDNIRKYWFNSQGLNHSLCVTGKFKLNSLELSLVSRGRR